MCRSLTGERPRTRDNANYRQSNNSQSSTFAAPKYRWSSEICARSQKKTPGQIKRIEILNGKCVKKTFHQIQKDSTPQIKRIEILNDKCVKKTNRTKSHG